MENNNIKKRREWWPIAIITVFILFGGSVIAAVVHSFGQDMSLVTSDYYIKELAYQDQINKEILTRELKKEVKVEMMKDGSGVILTFPLNKENPKPVTGKILCFRPSGADYDFTIDIAPDSLGMQRVDFSNHPKGSWRIQTDWKEGALEFYTDSQIMR